MTCVRDLAMKTLLSFLITLTSGIAAAQATVIQTSFDPPGVPLGTGAFTIGSGGKTASFSGGSRTDSTASSRCWRKRWNRRRRTRTAPQN